ncbi:DoxX family protein [Amycolatopsis sp. cmx-4-54]|uniref:DoxX family protein n=1 Tax=Amycolatopsis sp. cmx-4-54 TaxID=2790936 RepID=UPI00397B592E
MFTAYLIVAIVTIVLNAGAAIADFVSAPFVLKNSAAVDVPRSWIVPLGLAKAAGAAGLILGLFGVPYLGAAAAAGLVLFYIGAVLAHVRARIFRSMAIPGSLLALAAVVLLLDLAQAR